MDNCKNCKYGYQYQFNSPLVCSKTGCTFYPQDFYSQCSYYKPKKVISKFWDYLPALLFVCMIMILWLVFL